MRPMILPTQGMMKGKERFGSAILTSVILPSSSSLLPFNVLFGNNHQQRIKNRSSCQSSSVRWFLSSSASLSSSSVSSESERIRSNLPKIKNARDRIVPIPHNNILRTPMPMPMPIKTTIAILPMVQQRRIKHISFSLHRPIGVHHQHYYHQQQQQPTSSLSSCDGIMNHFLSQNRYYCFHPRRKFSIFSSIDNITAAASTITIATRPSSLSKRSSNFRYTKQIAMTKTTPQHHLIRFLTIPKHNSGKKRNETETTTTSLSSTQPASATTTTSSSSKLGTSNDSNNNTNNNKIQKLMDSTVSTVRPIVGSAEATIKRTVEKLSTGDLMSVYGIMFLLFVITTAPYMIRQMQHSDNNKYGYLDPQDDPVMDLARMIRNEYWGIEEDDDIETNENSESFMGLNRIVADLLKSPQIQEAVTNLLTKVIESSQFKTACQLLVKSLLRDLLNDPDTLNQVVHLLQNAIVDEKIQTAAVQLATDVFGDDRVLDELTTLVQRLGNEEKVQQSTQALLVESAHNALNDPEILDHSMEFATDVVGDDVVQQTAGEALYNTLSYAFRPTLSIVLSVLGIGLIFVSIAAFRNVNQIHSDATDRAFVDTVEIYTSRILKLLFFPLDFVTACKDAIVNTFFFPFRVVSSSISSAKALKEITKVTIQNWLLWFFGIPWRISSSIREGFRSKCSAITTFVDVVYQNTIQSWFLWLFDIPARFSSLIQECFGTRYIAITVFVDVVYQSAIKHISNASSRIKIQSTIIGQRLWDCFLHFKKGANETYDATWTTISFFWKYYVLQF